MRNLIREPLLHFLLLGAALFALYGWLNGGLPDAQNEIVVSRGQMRSLESQFERVWRRPPTPEELKGLIDNWVREEVMYREGLSMGLDRDDPVVRRRVPRNSSSSGTARFRRCRPMQSCRRGSMGTVHVLVRKPHYTLRQVYFDPGRHDDIAQLIARTGRARRRPRRARRPDDVAGAR